MDKGFDEQGVAYDLRQGYAHLLTRTIDAIKRYRDDNDYKNWLRELDGLYIDISMQMTEKEKQEYNRLLIQLNTQIESNPHVFDKNKGDSRLYIAMKKVNMYLWKMLWEHKILGSKDFDDSGL